MPFVALDFETTGLSPTKHRVIEIGAVVFESDGRVLHTFHSLVNPGGTIAATAIHGLSRDDLVRAPSFAQVLPSFADVLTGNKVVAHNAAFDMGFLKAELLRAGVRCSGIDALCTLEFVGRVKPELPRKLMKCCEALGIELLEGHHALNDASMTAQLAARLFSLAPTTHHVSPINIVIPRVLRADARPPLPRDAEYQQASASGSFFSELIAHLPRSSEGTGPGEAQYLTALEGALTDGEITTSEAEDLVEIAQLCRISSSRIKKLHLEYFRSLCEAAAANNYVSTHEKSRLKKLGLLLAIDDSEKFINRTTSIAVWQPGDAIRAGTASDPKAAANFLTAESDTDFSDPRVTSRLKGLRIVLTGTFSGFTREQGREAITRRGGSSPQKPSVKTDALVAGDGSGPMKLEEAASMGIPILTESEFLDLLASGKLPRRPN